MSKKTFKYSEAIDELNSIVADLESERIDVDDVSAKVKKAIELIKVCRDRINKTEFEVRTIVKEFEKETKEKSQED